MNDRRRCPVEGIYVGEEMTTCHYCGSRCHLDDGPYYAEGSRLETCCQCGQRYHTEDEDEGDD